MSSHQKFQSSRTAKICSHKPQKIINPQNKTPAKFSCYTVGLKVIKNTEIVKNMYENKICGAIIVLTTSMRGSLRLHARKFIKNKFKTSINRLGRSVIFWTEYNRIPNDSCLNQPTKIFDRFFIFLSLLF